MGSFALPRARGWVGQVGGGEHVNIDYLEQNSPRLVDFDSLSHPISEGPCHPTRPTRFDFVLTRWVESFRLQQVCFTLIRFTGKCALAKQGRIYAQHID